MNIPAYPNETEEHRAARSALLQEEQTLVDKTKTVAAQRRALPLGGKLKQDYTFEWAANGGTTGSSVRFSELFGQKTTLLLYSFMYGPKWDNPCWSCTSLVDTFDRSWHELDKSDVAFAVIGKAPADKINTFAIARGWTHIPLVSGFNASYQLDYRCQGESDNDQWTKMHVFTKQAGDIYHFWASDLPGNHVDTVWPFWNLMDMTPQGRPDKPTPPQDFHCNYGA